MIEFAKPRTSTIDGIVDEIIKLLKDISVNIDVLNQYDYQKLGNLWYKELSKHSIIDEDTIKNIINLSKQSLGISGKNLFIPLSSDLEKYLFLPFRTCNSNPNTSVPI